LFEDPEQILPWIESYSGTSPDFPSWLRPITDSVNLEPQSNTTLVDSFTVNYTWFVDDRLLKEECLFDEDTDSCTSTATMFQPTGESKFLVYQANSSTEFANHRTVAAAREDAFSQERLATETAASSPDVCNTIYICIYIFLMHMCILRVLV
jgi:hypothetical protein